MVTDTNIYWLDEQIFDPAKSAFLEELNTNSDYTGRLEKRDDGLVQIVVEKPTRFQNLNYVQGEYELEGILKDMDEAGVDHGVMKMPGCSEWISLDTCRKFNDGMKDYERRSNGRLKGLAVVPPRGDKEVLDEIDRCRNELGYEGFQLASHYGDKYLDDEQFAPFFEKLNEVPTVVYIHHSPLPTEYDALLDYNNLRRSFGRMEDQVIAVSREVFSGFFDKYPNLKFVHSMLGGGFFTLYEMMFPSSQGKKDSVNRFASDQTNARKNLKEHVYFETSHSQPWGKDQLECAVKVLGADHILYGSSYPVRKEWMLHGADFVRNLDISDEDKALILYKNAADLYKTGESA